MNIRKYKVFLLSLLSMTSTEMKAGGKILDDFSVILQSQSKKGLTRAQLASEFFIYDEKQKANPNAPISLSVLEKQAAIQSYKQMLVDIYNKKNVDKTDWDFYDRLNANAQKQPVSTVRRLTWQERHLRLAGWTLPTLQEMQQSSTTAHFKHPWLAATFRQTLRKIHADPDLIPDTINSLEKTKVMEYDLHGLIKTNRFSSATKISVKDENIIQTIENAQNLGKRVVVLNLANAYDTLGGDFVGSVAQEEELGRCTTLSQVLYPLALAGYYPLPEFGNILTEDTSLIRRGSENQYAPFLRSSGQIDTSRKFSVISAAAYNLKGHKADAPLNPKDRIEGTAKKILGIFQSLEDYIEKYGSQDTVFITGAFGCGAYGNDSTEIAGLFHAFLRQFGGIVPEVIFSIRGISQKASLHPFMRLDGQTYQRTSLKIPQLPSWQTNWNNVLPVTLSSSYSFSNPYGRESEDDNSDKTFINTSLTGMAVYPATPLGGWRLRIPNQFQGYDPTKYVMLENGKSLFSLKKPQQSLQSKLIEASTTPGLFYIDGNDIVFSSTDNSDPRQNGRNYVLGVKLGNSGKKVQSIPSPQQNYVVSYSGGTGQFSGEGFYNQSPFQVTPVISGAGYQSSNQMQQLYNQMQQMMGQQAFIPQGQNQFSPQGNNQPNQPAYGQQLQRANPGWPFIQGGGYQIPQQEVGYQWNNQFLYGGQLPQGFNSPFPQQGGRYQWNNAGYSWSYRG